MMDWLWGVVISVAFDANRFLVLAMGLGALVPPSLGILCRAAHSMKTPASSGTRTWHDYFARDRVRSWLGVFRDFGPALGLLGTVLGLMHALDAVAEHGSTTAETVRNLAPAMLTTVLGLLWLLGAGLGRAIGGISEE
jgi:hypothetical protein